MRVRQRLKINIVVSAVMALAIFLIFSLALYHINKATNLTRIAGDIVLNSFERLTLRNDYLQNDNERAKIQWFARHEIIGKILQTASKEFKSVEDEKTLDEMLKKHESTGKIFLTIVNNRQKKKSDKYDAAISQEVEDRLLSQLNIKVYEEVILGRKLLESSRKARASTLRLTGIGIACSLLVLFLAVMINSWTTGRAINDRVRRLRDGAYAIGDGDLDQIIDIKGNDEFAELAGVFNAMTLKLKTTYRDLSNEALERKWAEESLARAYEELEVRIAERTRDLQDAQISLREMNESLEQRVAERTSELMTANKSLRNSRKATLNIMEDAIAAGKRAERMSDELRREVSERIRAEEETKRLLDLVQEEKDRLSALINSISDEIWFADSEKRFTLLNKAAGREFRVESEEGIGVELLAANLEVFRPDGSPRPVEEAPPLRALQGEVVTNQVEIIRTPLTGALKYRQVSSSPVRNVGGNIIGSVSVVRDITELKKSESDVLKLSEDMAARNIELEAANKEMEFFIYSISHDLRAPIRNMSGFAKIIMEDYIDKLDAQGQDYLNRILKNSAKSTRLIEDLLYLSKISRYEITRQRVDMSKIALSIASELFEAAPGRDLDIDVKEGITAFADPRLIEIVITNLLENAWKFTAKTHKAHIEFGVSEQDGRTVYFIKDNGVGFDHKYSEKMFLPFHRLHSESEYEGTGIGLAIVDRIIHRHGGRIWAEGEVGKGATIYFTFGQA